MAFEERCMSKPDRGRFLSKTKNPMRRFDELANTTARDVILDGEIVVLGEGRAQSTR